MDELTNHIPVILLTAKSSSSNKLEGYETGADEYITKPFESKLLISRINSLIKVRQQLKVKYRGELGNILNSINENKEEDPFLCRATEIVESKLMETDFDGEKLAQEMAMSLRQLYRKMEAMTNQTVNEFIRTIQLKKGAQLLVEGKYNISEVCYLSGMSNPRYFSTLFKKHYGITPSEFIKAKDSMSL
jgi:AraC-like DNA-binding protein